MQSLRTVFDLYSATLRKRDFDGWGAIHTDDVIKLWPGAYETHSRDAMLVRIAKLMSGRRFAAFEVATTMDEVHDRIAFSWGHYTYRTESLQGGEPLDFSGKYLSVLRLQDDGTWRIAYDCFNSNTTP